MERAPPEGVDAEPAVAVKGAAGWAVLLPRVPAGIVFAPNAEPAHPMRPASPAIRRPVRNAALS
ncbi:MAG: hypothetical protein JXR72_05875, partial [Proteobacteria bacterium]|nr:hypothetical protein [Pseudomonadota bacterium]